MTLLKRYLNNDFILALICLAAYLCTNSYIFGWDDQHLELPLLQRLIDPTLYRGDYYVEGLVKNFSSYLYPLLAKVIKIEQIPSVYLFLFLVSRFFMFYWLLRLWQFISGDRYSSVIAVLMFFLMGRTEEFLYRTFSHQEFSYIFMFAGIFYFYKERFHLAALWFGLGANFHAIYNLFPFLYMCAYLLFFHRNRFTKLSSVIGVFALCAMPFILWQIPHSLHKDGASIPSPDQWLPLYLIACQQNFLFWTSTLSQALENIPFILTRLEPYFYLLGLYAFLLVVEKKVRDDKKLLSTVIVAYGFVCLTFIFSYIIPIRLVIDLNLLRNEQFVRLFLMGYLTLWAIRVAKEQTPWKALLVTGIWVILSFGSVFMFLPRLMQYKMALVFMGMIVLYTIVVKKHSFILKYLVCVALCVSFYNYARYHYQYLQVKHHGGGMWQRYRNWIDMQKFVEKNTPKDALILTPYDTEYGGFRIFSRRKVLVCYRDCGIVGFDFPATQEWKKRIDDLQGFQMYVKVLPQKALVNALVKYKVDYIVFMNYYQPRENNSVLKKIYQNEVLALYEVLH